LRGTFVVRMRLVFQLSAIFCARGLAPPVPLA